MKLRQLVALACTATLLGMPSPSLAGDPIRPGSTKSAPTSGSGKQTTTTGTGTTAGTGQPPGSTNNNGNHGFRVTDNSRNCQKNSPNNAQNSGNCPGDIAASP